MSTTDPPQTVLALLPGAKKAGDGQYMARCPAHDDAHASLSIGTGDDGRVLLYCQAGCAVADVVKALGLTMADLYPAKPGPSPRTDGNAAKGKPPTSKARIVTAYDYKDAAGALLYQSVRYEPKDFRFRRPDGNNGWLWNLGDTPRVLYRLPQLLAADKGAWVFVTEGEKDCDNVAALGLVATTNPGGAGKWTKLFDDSALHSRRVAIIPDRDIPGIAHAKDVASRLHGKAGIVKVIDLPNGEDDGKPIRDVSDWIESLDGRTPQDLAAALVGMAESAPPWTPGVVSVVSVSVPARTAEPYRPFPVEALPNPLRFFVAESAEAIGCDPAYVGLPALALAASAIGNTRRIELKHGWTEPPILWTVNVGESGTLKSPCLEIALKPVRVRERKGIARHTQAAKEHEAALLRHEVEVVEWKRNKGLGPPPLKPTAPLVPRWACDDTTVEALAVLLRENPRGLLLARDELAGWFGGFDRYVKGRGGDAPRWTEMHGGRPMTVDRKGGEPRTIYIPRAAVSVAGGIQPAILARALGRDFFENGLAARLLLAYPPRRVKRWSEAEIPPATETAYAEMIEGLYALDPATGDGGEPEPAIVRLAPDAKAAWIKFYNEHAEEHATLTGDLSAAWSKLEGYAARLAMVVHFVRCAAGDPAIVNPDVVDADSVAAGVALCRWFGQEARRVYAILGETDEARECRGLVELIGRHGGAMTARELMRCSSAYPTAEAAEAALTGLAKAGWGRLETPGPGPQGGRPATRFVLADTTDIDTTQETPKETEVVSVSVVSEGAGEGPSAPTEPGPQAQEPTGQEAPAREPAPSADTTPKPATPRTAARLDPDQPGPVDLLPKDRLPTYKAVYYSRSASMSPDEKHRRAWRAAVAGGKE